LTFSKIVSAIQDSASTVRLGVNTFLSREKCSKCLPSPFIYSVKLFLKHGTVLFNGPVENCPVSSPVWLFDSETVLGFRWRFQNSFFLWNDFSL